MSTSAPQAATATAGAAAPSVRIGSGSPQWRGADGAGAAGDLEVVLPDVGSTVRWASHGYPVAAARWHHHPEIEFHLITATHGQMMVGNRTVDFAPGQVSLMGPHLPHNWMSDLAPGETVTERDVLCQVLPEALAEAALNLPELAGVSGLVERSRRGILLTGSSADRAGSLLVRMGERDGLHRLATFLELLAVFLEAPGDEWTSIIGPGYVPSLDDATAERINAVLDYIDSGIDGELSMTGAAGIVALSPSAFSRFFHAAAGVTFSELVRRRRVARACHLLRTTELPVTRVADLCGYANLSNFNRRFRQETGCTPTDYRLRSGTG